jgi:prepilin-type N-terminal cleavage/methylation domain-containing protein
MGAISRRKVRSRKSQLGFSLVEVIVASVVVTVGLLSVASMFASSLAVIKYAEFDTIARQEAQQMIEGIFAGRNSGAIQFNQIANQGPGGAGPGIFVNGLTPALQPGADGIMNTGDDGPGLDVGPDGRPLGNFSRSVQVNPVLLPGTAIVDPNVVQVVVSVQYRMGNLLRTYSQATYVSRYR